MATAGLSGRLAKAAEPVEALAFARLAGDQAGELWAFYPVLRARYGPRATARDQAELLAERCGGNVADVYRQLTEAQAAHTKRGTG